MRLPHVYEKPSFSFWYDTTMFFLQILLFFAVSMKASVYRKLTAYQLISHQKLNLHFFSL